MDKRFSRQLLICIWGGRTGSVRVTLVCFCSSLSQRGYSWRGERAASSLHSRRKRADCVGTRVPSSAPNRRQSRAAGLLPNCSEGLMALETVHPWLGSPCLLLPLQQASGGPEKHPTEPAAAVGTGGGCWLMQHQSRSLYALMMELPKRISQPGSPLLGPRVPPSHIMARGLPRCVRQGLEILNGQAPFYPFFDCSGNWHLRNHQLHLFLSLHIPSSDQADEQDAQPLRLAPSASSLCR